MSASTPVSTDPRPTEDSVCKTVRGKLIDSGFSDLRNVVVKGTGERLRIEGAVHSYYMKQMAGSIAITVPGVLRLENAVEVQ